MLFTQSLLRNVWKYALGVSLFAVSLLFVSTTAIAADKAVGAYQQERAACQSAPDRKDCLRDAGAALDASKHGQLTSGDAELYERNALMRCKALPESDRQDCVRRVHGEGQASGSVSGGGVFRETKTIIVDPPAQPAAMPEQPRYRSMPAPMPMEPQGNGMR
jgi:hypothetical protein